MYLFSLLQGINLEHPSNAVLALPLLAVLALSWFASIRSRRRAFKQYGNERLISQFSETPDSKREARIVGIIAAALFVIGLAATMPYINGKPTTVSAGSMRVVSVFDTSISMEAEDDRRDMDKFGGQSCADVVGKCGRRIDIVKSLLLNRLMPALEKNQMALVTYAGAGVIKSYFTDDFEPLKTLLNSGLWVDVGGAQGQGSYVAEGLKQALLIFDHDKVANSVGNIIVLFSDGGHDDESADLKKATDELRSRGIRLVIVGVGSAKDSPIPLYDGDGKISGYFPGSKPYKMTSRDDQFLKSLADQTGGIYIPADPGVPLNVNWPSVLAGSKVVVQKVYLYQYPLGLGMFVLLLVFLRQLPMRLMVVWSWLRTKKR